jgi:hypothetical protein
MTQDQETDLFTRVNSYIDLLEARNWDVEAMAKLNREMRSDYGHDRVDKAQRALLKTRRLMTNDR